MTSDDGGSHVVETVPAALAGERIDRVVAFLTGLPRSEVATLVEAGRVTLSGQPVTTRSRRVGEGDLLAVDVPPAKASGLVPDPGVDVTIVHVDESVIVVDKPAGLVVHPGAGHAGGTLVHGLLARFPDLAVLEAVSPGRPGIVHRIDKGTSGLLVIARLASAYEDLVRQMAARLVGREYLTLAWGTVEADSGMIDAPVGRSGGDPTRMAVSRRGRPARTRYQVTARHEHPMPVTELSCALETGRTHQIRVHLAAIGHPVVGDVRYGGKRPGLVIPRPYLHAAALSFDHPRSGERLSFTSALPEDLQAVRRRLS